MKKIIVISNSSWNIFNFRKNLLIGLISNGNKVYIVAPHDEYINKLNDIDCDYIPINFKKNKISLLTDFLAILTLLKIFIKIKPDFILSYTIKPNLYSSLLSIFFPNTKSVINITGLGTMFFKNKIYNSLYLFLYKFIINISDHILFQNRDDQSLLTSNNNRNYKTTIIPGSGIDINFFEFKKYIKSNKKINFLFVGRLIKEKGIVEFLEAAKIVRLNYPSITFDIIGLLDENNPSSISMKYLQTYQASHTINYHGFKDDVKKSLISCDCIILPSYREGSSRVLLEAGAIGRCSIASNVPGCSNIIEDNYNGFLCAPKNIDSLVQSIIRFINLSDREKEKLSVNARNNIVKNFSDKVVTDKYINIINSNKAENK